ncbi:DUF2515 family protein [Effusibacillus dendaii]|uniref:DUF2515 domain-containing protein n=1 Tax=Effusibacillus dendaii TaxID=2743772 RepID=A0A7I8D7T9_9BACL|nr:DUF2515 family protein [Effusibacillus dendaii]BCJ85069.1 hypothetical protein skT53_00540 [Effusibacillus dendaii]
MLQHLLAWLGGLGIHITNRRQMHLRENWRSIRFSGKQIDELKKRALQLADSNVYRSFPRQLTEQENRLVSRIDRITSQKNRNNVTRTEAYRQIYFQHPELHWALLAHMVSRNGGYHMTDLRGELIPRLLSADEIESFFQSLERANSLIFHDAYPQLLLYAESVRQQKNYFHLLPAFGVSRFMMPVWEDFLATHDSRLLTVALIINEQHYIERRVVKHPHFAKHVYQTLEFQAQALLQLTQIVFPYYRDSRQEIELAGVTVEQFTELQERIGIGKSLYSILFGIQEVYRGALQLAKQVPHTGSRADFWPHLFSKERRHTGDYKEQRLLNCRLKSGAALFYSPELASAWDDRPFEALEQSDWFADTQAQVFDFFEPFAPPAACSMNHLFCLGLNELEAAVVAKERFA